MADDSSGLNQVLSETAFLYGGNADFVEALYAKWASDPASVEPSWQAFFSTLREKADEVTRAAQELSLIHICSITAAYFTVISAPRRKTICIKYTSVFADSRV